MSNYCAELKQSARFPAIAPFLPEGICPFLYYNLVPYVHVMAQGGWFDWTERNHDVTRRRTPDARDFQRKDVNRRYPNEVLVRCPNPAVMVVAGVGKWLENALKIRILAVRGDCPWGHAVSGEITVSEKLSQALRYNQLFTEVLCGAFAGKAPKMECGFSPGAVELSGIIHPCRYHKGTESYPGDLLPDGFCPHVFAAAYPEIFGVMYNVEEERRIRVTHPGDGGEVVLAVRKARKTGYLGRSILRGLKSLFETLFHPVDLIDFQIEIGIQANSHWECSLKPGNTYRVNLADRNHLCPASFHALYPYLALAKAGRHLPWTGTETDRLAPCPDCIGAVYSLRPEEGCH